MKNAKNLFFAVQIEKTETLFAKTVEKKAFSLLTIKIKTIFESH